MTQSTISSVMKKEPIDPNITHESVDDEKHDSEVFVAIENEDEDDEEDEDIYDDCQFEA
jgi:hypothetical protein